MSYRSDNKWSIKGVDLKRKTQDEIDELFKKVLESGMHGLCYSAYEEGQQPGSILTETQIRKRMAIIAPYTKWVRTFSCIEGNELIPKIAKEFGLKTFVGAWLGDDKELLMTRPFTIKQKHCKSKAKTCLQSKQFKTKRLH